MPNQILQENLASIAFGVAASFDPVDDGTNFTDDLITIDYALTAGAPTLNGAARQSIKADLGTPRAPKYALYAAVDFTGETPTATGKVDYYWAPSTNATQANGNIAGNSGADAACPDGALGSITLAEFLEQCIPIGSLKTHDGASVQNGFVGYLLPPTQWGQLIEVNNSGDAFEADDVEHHAVLVPIVDEVQG